MQILIKRKKENYSFTNRRSVDNFCNILIKIINKPYRNGRNNFLTPAEKLDYLRRFCEERKLRNEDIRKACKRELIETHVSGVPYEQ